MELVSTAPGAIFSKLQSLGVVSSVLGGGIRLLPTLGAGEVNNNSGFTFSGHIYSIMPVKAPAPTVLPPSLIAKRNSFSRATG